VLDGLGQEYDKYVMSSVYNEGQGHDKYVMASVYNEDRTP